MDLFDYIGTKLRDTFSYFKSRTKNKYEGDRFEEWVVSNSNIQKDPRKSDGNPFWRLLEWRGDKYIKGWYALSNLSPDLILECVSNKENKIYCTGQCIAVECKYRNHRNDFFLKKEHIVNYEEYVADEKNHICALFYIFGFGWKNDAPEEVYLIPSTAIYEYDRKSQNVDFKCSRDESAREDRYKDYKVVLDNTQRKYYIQYTPTQS